MCLEFKFKFSVSVYGFLDLIVSNAKSTLNSRRNNTDGLIQLLLTPLSADLTELHFGKLCKSFIFQLLINRLHSRTSTQHISTIIHFFPRIPPFGL